MFFFLFLSAAHKLYFGFGIAIELLYLFFLLPVKGFTTCIYWVGFDLSLSLYSFPAIVRTKLLLMIVLVLEVVNILIFGLHSIIKILRSSYEQ